MAFVPMDDFSYCGIILSICFLLQLATAIPINVLNPVCYSEETKQEHLWTYSSSESSVLLTWDYSADEYNESDGTKVHHYVFNKGDYLVLKYSPCWYETFPTLVYDSATDVYLVQYDLQESFYSQKTRNLSWVKSHLMAPTLMRVNVTNLPFPGWSYAFYLDGVISGLGHRFAEVRGRTSPAFPKVCAGCFRTLSTLPKEQIRKIRVYWPHRVGQQVTFLLSVSERLPNHTTTLIFERGISDDQGYVDVLISLRSHVFQFRSLNVTELPKNSIIVVPDDLNVFEWVPGITTTIDSNRTAEIRALSWEKPTDVDVVEYYTLVWYDKKKWRENPDLSPIMDWIYLPGNLMSIKFRMVDSKEDEDERVGWRLIANTETSSCGIQHFGDLAFEVRLV